MHTHTYTHAHTHIYMHTHTHTYTHTHTHTHAHTHIHMHTHTYTHAHTVRGRNMESKCRRCEGHSVAGAVLCSRGGGRRQEGRVFGTLGIRQGLPVASVSACWSCQPFPIFWIPCH
ncbi:hypothetical protein AALO_G00002170 [Alosa alosa]|uniref:Uncharacterized protein n=1 Tax=Alosa alosa TaxID=278164 RepID=A0AAV6HHG6_9TELE|nr:hypothetical protein AALO_G00002170 [Alosa alosa]